MLVGWNLQGVVYDGYLVPRVLHHLFSTLTFYGTLDLEGVVQSARPVPGTGEGVAGMLDIGVSV